jgi:hypothetical protein
MIDSHFADVLNMVDEINSVNLSEAYVSIEVDRVSELVQFLKDNKIESSVTHWNHPESLYVGNQKDKKDLVVLAIHW